MKIDLTKKIILAFYKEKKIISSLIRFFAGKDKYSHVEILNENHLALTANYNIKSKLYEHQIDSNKWDYIVINVTYNQYKEINKNMNNLIGYKYDFKSILGLLFGININSLKDLYCVEVVNKSLNPIIPEDFGLIDVDTFYEKTIDALRKNKIENNLKIYI